MGDISKLRGVIDSIPQTIDLTASGNVLKVENFKITDSGVTASKPLKLDADKKFTSGDIDLTTEVTGTLPVGNGGTGSASAMNNNRFIISSGGAIVEQSALTGSRAVQTDSNGLPEASTVTSTELGYVSGVTSGIQTQLNALSTGYSRRQAVIEIVADNTADPAARETHGNRYILAVDGGSPHAGWDGASAGDIVEFVTDTWVAVSPLEGYVAYSDSDNKDALYVDDGTPAWELRPVAVTDHVDLANKGTYTHTELDSHLDDATKHFLLLDEDDMASDDDSKAPSQQSTKKYVDDSVGALTHDGFADFVANEHLPGIDEDDMTSDSASHVPTQQSVKAYVDAQVGGSSPDNLSYASVAGEAFAANTSFAVREMIGANGPSSIYDEDLNSSPGNISDDQTRAGSPFSDATGGTLGTVKAWLERQSSATTNNLIMDIYDDNSGEPGSVIANGSSNAVAVNTLAIGTGNGAAATEIEFTWSTPPTIAASTTYHCVLRGDGSFGGGQVFVFTSDSTPNVRDWSTDGGTNWSSFSGYMSFEIILAGEEKGKVYKASSDEENEPGEYRVVGLVQVGGTPLAEGDACTVLRFNKAKALGSSDSVIGSSSSDDGAFLYLNKAGAIGLDPSTGITAGEKYAIVILGKLNEYNATAANEEIMVDAGFGGFMGFDLG